MLFKYNFLYLTELGLTNGLIQYREFVRLYPRSTGNKVLPVIALGGAIAPAVKIKVKAAIRNNIDGTPYWLDFPKTIWQGQTIKIAIEQNLLHPSNQVIVEDALFPEFTVSKLKPIITNQDNQKKIQISWLITSHNYGSFDLELPAITQRGRGRWRFYLSSKKITVQPVPSYIPPTVPVGKLSLTSGLFFKQNKPFWFIEIQNQGQLTEEVYGVRNQISKLTGIAVESILPSQKLKSVLTNSNLPSSATIRYQFAVPDWTFGFFLTPKIKISYFDITSEQIQFVTNYLPSVWYIPKLAVYFFSFLLAFTGFCLIWMIVKQSKKVRTKWHFRQQLKTTSTADDIRKLLLSTGDFLSLEDWSKAYSSIEQKNRAKDIAKQLNRLCYEQTSEANANCKSSNKVKQLILHFFD